VTLRGQIAADVTMIGLQTLSGHPLLIREALHALKQWRYEPMVLQGQPAEILSTISVVFALPDECRSGEFTNRIHPEFQSASFPVKKDETRVLCSIFGLDMGSDYEMLVDRGVELEKELCNAGAGTVRQWLERCCRSPSNEDGTAVQQRCRRT
jgi:hypothetical protein